jgi:hypothetical protein
MWFAIEREQQRAFLHGYVLARAVGVREKHGAIYQRANRDAHEFEFNSWQDWGQDSPFPTCRCPHHLLPAVTQNNYSRAGLFFDKAGEACVKAGRDAVEDDDSGRLGSSFDGGNHAAAHP